MADVRSMLRQERAARQQHSRPVRQSPAPAAAPASKKRKATDDGADGAEERKRTRTEDAKGVPAGFFDRGMDASDEDVDPALGATSPAQHSEAQTLSGPLPSGSH